MIESCFALDRHADPDFYRTSKKKQEDMPLTQTHYSTEDQLILILKSLV